VVVLGGGLSGIAAAYTLARAGWKDVSVVERSPELGGLAGTFHQDDRFYPLAYHHILHRDRALLYFLDAVGVLPRVRWRKIRMLFHVGGRLLDLARPDDFLRFPMAFPDKLRFVRLMTRCFRKSDWSDWLGRPASELVDAWGGAGVREAIFEPLCRLKFDLPCDEVSAAWLGARLHFREGSAPLGFVPGCNWTKELCDGLERLLERHGVRVLRETAVRGLHADGDRIAEVELDGGERVGAEVVVSTLPTVGYLALAGKDDTPHLARIRYTAVVSAICATRQRVEPDFYWMNLPSLDFNASGVFRLESLNPTIGGADEACLNFVTHVAGREREFFSRSDDSLFAGYADDFRRIFGFDLDPAWSRIHRLPLYSPVLDRGYRNPACRSSTWRNVYFAGNYRTFPSIASTGTALGSGVEAGQAVLEDHGGGSDLPGALRGFRLGSMPRG
jgi:protoporphyrinogen oxidase